MEFHADFSMKRLPEHEAQTVLILAAVYRQLFRVFSHGIYQLVFSKDWQSVHCTPLGFFSWVPT
jgi:hypothetical protein